VRVGLFIPNGIAGEFRGWDVRAAWKRSLEIARLAEQLGFDSLWVPDHLQNIIDNDGAPCFEAFTHLTALAEVTRRVTLAPGVACVGFRNPALLVKMLTTLDVASDGRAELAIGAGWNASEWTRYGYGFPPARERLAMLGEALEIITRMLQPGRPTWHGRHYRVNDVVCEPKGVQSPRLPLIVGGNGPNVTWRLAARYADELNLDAPKIEDIPSWLPTIHHRCEEIGRDPASLRLSALIHWRGVAGQQRVEALARMAELGLARMQSTLDLDPATDDELHALVADCRAAGCELLTA
jgi:F420-dependent oxidoreductase-like protein